MRMRRRPRLARTTTLAAVAVVASGFLLAGTVHAAGESAARVAARAWHSVFPDHPKTAVGKRMIIVLAPPSVAERAAASPSHPSASEEKQWTHDILAMQASVVAALRQRGIQIEPRLVFTHVLDGFSASLDGRAVAELERNPLVVGVYPVRAVYPAEVQTADGPGQAARIALAGFDGSGVSIALLDTGVDRTHPGLEGQVGTGHDFVDGDRHATPERSADEAARLETHGTRMAGIALGVAPGARILPFRILGWQHTESGEAVFGGGDLLIAGLERAVDPNGDGSSRDAVQVALAPVVEPFAAFVDSPESRAVTGATALGTLVVAPSGNDGDVGLHFGSVAAPGAAPDALSVGAVDTRSNVYETRLTLSVGGGTAADGAARLLGGVMTGRGMTLGIAGLLGPSLADPSRATDVEAGGSELRDFFDSRGVSRVAGRAAIVPADGTIVPADGTSLARKAANAKAAGATALLVYGTDLPAGALDLDNAGALPVIAVPGEAGSDAVDALRNGEQVEVALGQAEPVGNGAAGRVAAFSSGGLAFDGRVRPDLVAPGVSLATVDARAARGQRALYATATGSSAAAAVVAGAAALVKEARPQLDAGALRAVLVGSAKPLGEASTREGAGIVDVSAAAEAQLAVEPSSVAFGRGSARQWSSSRTITVTNVSQRTLEVGFASVADELGAAVGFTAAPATLKLGPGASAQVTLGISARNGVGVGASGVVLAIADGAAPARVPWAVGRSPDRALALVDSVSISNWEFEPSSAAPSVVAFRAGRADPNGDGSIEPVGLLQVELWTADGKKLGVIARLRDLLPGRYAIGLTGRDADGKVLPAGTYVLRLRAQPVDAEDGTPSSTAQTVFRIKERS
jgi:subtilisin family serine protease